MTNEFTAVIERDGEWFIAFCPEVPGANGQGKTNFLEAVGYLGTLRSIRSGGRAEMIRHGESAGRATGAVLSGGLERILSFTLTGKGRQQFIDDKRIASPEAFLQALKVVHFIPEDVSLVGGSPSWRRKVIDRSVFEIVNSAGYRGSTCSNSFSAMVQELRITAAIRMQTFAVLFSTGFFMRLILNADQ